LPLDLFTAAGWTRLGQTKRPAGYEWERANNKAHDADILTQSDATHLLRMCAELISKISCTAEGAKQQVRDAVARTERLFAECAQRDRVTAATTLSELGGLPPATQSVL
jgi:hypothetical protein